MKVTGFWQCSTCSGKEEILEESAKTHSTSDMILHKRNLGRKKSRVPTARERGIHHVDRA